MRISTSQIFSQTLTQMNSSLNDVTELNMMTSSQKKLNRPSDDPAGMGTVMALRSYNQNLSGYIDTCGTANDYLGLADQALMQASENVTAAMEQAEQASNETYTDEQLNMMAMEMESYQDSLLTIANTQTGSDSVFAGDDTQSNAYEKGLGVTLPNDSLTHSDFNSITGEIDSTVAVQFTSDGTVGVDSLDYQYSTDGGETWTTATLAAGDTQLDLGDCQVDLANGTAVTDTSSSASGTEFYVREAMHYIGSDTAMSVDISESTEIDMTSVGSDYFGGVDADTGQPYSSPNLFEIIGDCIVYMEMGDADGVAACLDELHDAHEQLEAGAASVGARENQIEYTQQSQALIKEINTNSISRQEDADAAQLVVELQQANYVYEAVLSTSSSIMNISLLNYI